jgi:hypothetical protein
VGRVRPWGDRTVAEGMRGDDDALAKQGIQLARRSLYQPLAKEPLPPVLLTLTSEVLSPRAVFELASEAEDDQDPRRPESPPVRLGS